ncbi:MAG: SUMF1/EgtB/PvdO family nonheme iron enzyme, partial [Anaerolineales bacterium]|nr:SUMF1/EgtB/PvdO family nonheme iron enzyme [Anaerolineales bacterium]
GSYSSSSSSNPQGPGSGTYRVLRGGGWSNSPNYLRVADRYNDLPGYQDYYIGFRCGVSVLPNENSTPQITSTPLTPTPTPEQSAELPTTLTDEKGVPMALVPAGEFQMGSEDGADDEKPVHTVYLDAFYMDIYEVTNAQYEKCVQAGACSSPVFSKSSTRTSYYWNANYADYPVININWEQARVFCEEWRGARLPTEAEWEKAARGGLESKLYPWGDEAPVCQKGAASGANFISCTSDDTEPVGSYSANGYGLFDMAGNVLEWVWDWYGAYSSASSSNPQGSNSGTYRVLRGGGWGHKSYGMRVALRGSYNPGVRGNFVGFRCGVNAPPGR